MLSLCYGFILTQPSERRQLIDSYFLESLSAFKEEVVSFKNVIQQKSSQDVLRKKFLEARLSYKVIAVLTDYFNPYEIKHLNGPAIDRIEKDNPDIIIPPHGFQVIETIIFGEWNDQSYAKITAELDHILLSIARMETEQDRIYKFKDDLLWDALRSSLISITTLGVTGFDSPVANLSLPEARGSLEGLSEVLAFFEADINRVDSKRFSSLRQLIRNADVYLQTSNDFNSFNRLSFITGFINPLYKEVAATRKILAIATPAGNRPFNFQAESLFAEDALNMDFYSPEKEYLATPSRVALGKKLFNDPILSGTGTRSCASCHKSTLAFTDGLALPLSIDNKKLLLRNTPTLWNSVFQTTQFYDSRTSSLETQLSEVVHNTDEMKGSLAVVAGELKKSEAYKQLFAESYGAEQEPLVAFTIANAISSYVRSLVALNSRFDQYMAGNKSAMTKSEKNGFNLFTGKARCATCHFMPLFNGLVPPEFTDTESEILGVPKTKDKKNAVLDTDLGKYEVTQSIIHKHAFKTPTLRNIALTAPYMHNGVYNTLEDVMEFYNNGGGAGLNIAPPNQTLAPDKLNLSKKEVSDIISFLKALTDTTSRQ
jgi:cytochrome c peroxidase